MLPFRSTSVPIGPALRGPNGVDIPCWGEYKTVLTLNGHSFPWVFLRAAVDFAILGVDSLSHFNLLVDAAAGRLIDTRGRFVLCLRGPPAMAAVQEAPTTEAAHSLRSRIGEKVNAPSGSLVTSGGEKAAPSSPPSTLADLLHRFETVLNARSYTYKPAPEEGEMLGIRISHAIRRGIAWHTYKPTP